MQLISIVIHIITQLKGNQLIWNETYINSRKEINNEDPIFKIGNIVRISKNNISAEGYVPNWSVGFYD